MAILLLFAIAELAINTTNRHHPSLFVYGATSTFGGRAPDTNVTIVTPKAGGAYSENVTLTVNIQAPEGYSLEWHAVLFQEYLFAEALIDCDREEVINTLNVDYHEQGDRYQIFFFNGSVKIPLSYSESVYHGETVLPYLPAGLHTVTVWVRAEQNMMSFYPFLWTALSDTIAFTMDFTAPKISVLSPEPLAYTTSDVLLVFGASEPVSRAAYSLDGQANVTVAGNTTLTGLSGREHALKVYGWDEAGNVGASEIVTFTVAVAQPFPTALVALASLVSAVAVGAGLLLYFKKRKR